MAEPDDVSADTERPGVGDGDGAHDPAGPPPLTPAQQAELAAANDSAEAILKAGRVATFNGWTLGTFGVLSVVFGFGSLTALVVGAGLLVVAWNEFRGRDMLRRFRPAGARLLGRNQVGLMALIVAYCLWSIYGTVHHPAEWILELEELAGGPGTITRTIAWGYGAVAVLSILVQGLNARYYFARGDMLKSYLVGTPPWIIQLQRATTGLRQ